MLDRPTGGQHEVAGRQVGRRARVATAAVGALVVLAAVVAVASAAQLVVANADRVDADRATAAAEAEAATTADELAAQRAFLAESGVDLATARRALTAVDDVLDVASHDRAAVASELEAAEEQLRQLQEAVSGAEGEVFVNASLVNGLAECLDGVSGLVNQLSVGDRAGAVRTAEAIAPACAAVGAAIA